MKTETQVFHAPIVGMRFRPPAEEVINLLPIGTPLILEREPENEYDVNAVKVLVAGFSEEGPLQDIYRVMLADHGDDESKAASLTDPYFLGYIAREKAEHLSPWLAAAEEDHTPFQSKLIYSAEGRPTLEMTMEVEVSEVQTQENPANEHEG